PVYRVKELDLIARVFVSSMRLTPSGLTQYFAPGKILFIKPNSTGGERNIIHYSSVVVWNVDKISSLCGPKGASYTDLICDLLKRALEYDWHVAVAPRNDATPSILCLSKGIRDGDQSRHWTTIPVLDITFPYRLGIQGYFADLILDSSIAQ
ncbi:MAG: hypothetical protein WBO18_00455, partial [Gammaproteobacteria bacterium]